tara:strand:- start:5483 stop:6748 length:1266 start_codon:yes stop_codon:yes gene_type:complete
MKLFRMLALPVMSGLVSMPGWAADNQLSSLLEVELAYAPKAAGWQKQEIIWRPEWVTRFDSGARLTLLGEVRFDVKDELDPGQPEQPFRARLTKKGFPDDHAELELREFYLDHYVGDAFLRIGKQQIVWGQADGLRVLDVLNPLSYREFILPDIEHRRIPLWSALTEIPLENWTAQVVWIPDATVTESTLPGATYSLILGPFAGRGRMEVDRPDSLAQSDLGLKLSTFQQGWDLSLNYLYHTVDDPLIQFDTAEQKIQAEYNRSHLFGGTASKPFGDLTFRSELGLETKKRSLDPITGNIQNTAVGSYVIGLDYSGFSDWFISTQFFQKYRFSAGDGEERSKEQVTLLIRRSAMNNALVLEALGIYDIDNRDSLIQLEAEYLISTNLVIRTGADLFLGNREGTFGRFHKESRLIAGFTLSF